jgi:ubiquinone/menaquinone biosynthesis C-methylase UbiE
MNTDFPNIYDDEARAEAYATVDFPGTYYLAYRDLPAIIAEHVRGGKAIDFGCGAGRSTRFLRALGFEVVGIDISAPMLAQARKRDPKGDYRLVVGDDLSNLAVGAYDLVLSAFTFDNIPTIEKKITLLQRLKSLLSGDGKIVNVVSSPQIYINEWTSFSTKAFPGNRTAQCGDEVQIVMLDVEDRRPVVDILWTDKGYREVYERAGLKAINVYRPLGDAREGYSWVSETKIAPWVIYVLGESRH